MQKPDRHFSSGQMFVLGVLCCLVVVILGGGAAFIVYNTFAAGTPMPLSADSSTAIPPLPFGLTWNRTRLGMKEPQMTQIADFMVRVLIENEAPESVMEDVVDFREPHQKLYYCFYNEWPA
jgi:hypothetical protein